MNILSTPTASTRNGMTSMMIKVAGTPRYPKSPTDAATDARTIETPATPRAIWLSICKRLKFNQQLHHPLEINIEFWER